MTIHPLPTPSASVPAPIAAAPTVKVFGCGGFGINAVRMTLPEIAQRVDYVYIDTSRANIRPNEELHLLGGGDGSGMVRATNAQSVNSQIVTLFDHLDIADVNAVVFGGAGGSGSVIAPLAIREIKRHGGIIVAFMLIDTSSQLATQNSINTLKSLEAVCKAEQIYLPIFLLGNSGNDRAPANATIRHRLAQFVHLETLPTTEADREDRKNWLAADRTAGAPAGMRQIHFASGKLESYEPDDNVLGAEIWQANAEYIYDTVLTLGVPNREDSDAAFYVKYDVDARVVYRGTFAADLTLTPIMGIVGSDGASITQLIKALEQRMNKFNSQQKKAAPVIAVKDDEIDETGLVL